MKKIWIAVLALLLTGCAVEETYETVSDEILQPAMARPGQTVVSLPGEAEMPAMENEEGRVYLASDYEIYIQTLESGDLNGTIRAVSGFEKDALTVMHTREKNAQRYEFVWSSAGEMGDRIGRAVILDDGQYHYVLTVLRDAESTRSSQIVWNDVFASFSLV